MSIPGWVLLYYSGGSECIFYFIYQFLFPPILYFTRNFFYWNATLFSIPTTILFRKLVSITMTVCTTGRKEAILRIDMKWVQWSECLYYFILGMYHIMRDAQVAICTHRSKPSAGIKSPILRHHQYECVKQKLSPPPYVVPIPKRCT